MNNPRIEYFNNLAPEWASVPIDAGKIHHLLNKIPFHPGETILDTGCGTGKLLPFLADSAPDCKLAAGIDFAIEMLRAGNRCGTAAEAVLVNSAIENMPFLSSSFTKIFCLAIFPHAENKQRFMKECHRILKKTGRLYIMHLSPRDDLNAFHAGLNGIVKDDHLPPENRIRIMLEETGFSDIEYFDGDGVNYTFCRKK